MKNKEHKKPASVSESVAAGTGVRPKTAELLANEDKAAAVSPTVSKEAKLPSSLAIEILLQGDAPKLSPGSTDTISYVVGWDAEPEQLVMQITGNSGGGLHTKKPFPLADVIALLDNVKEKQPFSSAMFKALWNNKGSSNNAGFLAAILRHLELIKGASTGRFSHQITGKHSAWFEELQITEPTKPVITETP